MGWLMRIVSDDHVKGKSHAPAWSFFAPRPAIKPAGGGSFPDAGAALDTSAHNVSAPDSDARFQVAKRRRDRRILRSKIREVTTIDRVRDCGHKAVSGAVSIRCAPDGSHAGLGGVATCGNAKVCPDCAAKIGHERAKELKAVLDWAVSAGHTVNFVTLTARHHKGLTLDFLWDGMGKAYRRMNQGRAWKSLRDRLAMVGWVRYLETMISDETGYHLHYHLVWITDGKPSEMDKAAYFDRWATCLAKEGLSCVRQAQDWETVRAGDTEKIAEYVTKFAKEATLGSFKESKKGASRSPFTVIKDYFRYGHESDLEIWRHWETVSQNRRMVTWSVGLRDLAGLGKEKSDEEIAAEQHNGETVALIRNAEWKRIRHLAPEVLFVFELDGIDAGRRFMTRCGIIWEPPPEFDDDYD